VLFHVATNPAARAALLNASHKSRSHVRSCVLLGDREIGQAASTGLKARLGFPTKEELFNPTCIATVLATKPDVEMVIKVCKTLLSPSHTASGKSIKCH